MDKIVNGVHGFQNGDFQQDKDFFAGLAAGQSPSALMITCSDSRIDPNALTQTRPGELFVLRTAGNIVPPYGAVLGGEAATIEYAVAALKIPNIIVCGHSHCGAMSGLLTPENLGSLPAVRSYLEHAASTRQIIEENYDEFPDFADKLSQTVETNVLVQIENLRTHPTVAAAVRRGDLEVHGWVYRFETGEVTAFDADANGFRPL
ncbi:MAG: carbonic anhydrase [Planctomycetota bacterium]